MIRNFSTNLARGHPRLLRRRDIRRVPSGILGPLQLADCGRSHQCHRPGHARPKSGRHPAHTGRRGVGFSREPAGARPRGRIMVLSLMGTYPRSGWRSTRRCTTLDRSSPRGQHSLRSPTRRSLLPWTWICM